MQKKKSGFQHPRERTNGKCCFTYGSVRMSLPLNMSWKMKIFEFNKQKCKKKNHGMKRKVLGVGVPLHGETIQPIKDEGIKEIICDTKTFI